jgi:hypothetical protein
MEIGLPALVAYLYWRRCQTLAPTEPLFFQCFFQRGRFMTLRVLHTAPARIRVRP